VRANFWLHRPWEVAPHHSTSTTSTFSDVLYSCIVHSISVLRHHTSFWSQLHQYRITVKDHRRHITSLDQPTYVLDSIIAIKTKFMQWKVSSALHVSRLQRELTCRHSPGFGQCQPLITHRARPIWTRHSPLHLHTYRQRSVV